MQNKPEYGDLLSSLIFSLTFSSIIVIIQSFSTHCASLIFVFDSSSHNQTPLSSLQGEVRCTVIERHGLIGVDIVNTVCFLGGFPQN